MLGLASLKRSEKMPHLERGKARAVAVMHLRRGRLSRPTEPIQSPLAGLKDACTHGIIPAIARGGASNNSVGGSSSEPEDEERKERVGSLAAAAHAVVDRAIDNPGLFKGIFEQARGLLSILGVEGYIGSGAAPGGQGQGGVNPTCMGDDEDDINWDELENESQEAAQMEGEEQDGHVPVGILDAAIVVDDEDDNNWGELMNANQEAPAKVNLRTTQW